MNHFKFVFLFMIGFLPTTKVSEEASTHVSRLREQPCDIENVAFKDAEQLTYRVYYNWGVVWLSAAEVVFSIKETPKTYHITAVGKTLTSYEWLYKVHDVFECEVDKVSLLPKWSVRRIHENNYTQYEKMIFNQTNGTVTSIKGKTEKETETKVIKITDCAHDILSILYFVRNYNFQTFKAGEKFPVKVFLDRENNNMQAKYDGALKSKDIKGLGKFKAHSVSPSTIEGKVFNEKSSIKLFISNDKNQIPLLIESDLRVGGVKAVLKSYKNLRYPLDSKVK